MHTRADVPCKHSLRLSEILNAIWKTVEGKKKNSPCLYNWRVSYNLHRDPRFNSTTAALASLLSSCTAHGASHSRPESLASLFWANDAL